MGARAWAGRSKSRAHCWGGVECLWRKEGKWADGYWARSERLRQGVGEAEGKEQEIEAEITSFVRSGGPCNP